MAKQCELIIGFLLPRRCEEKGVVACGKCKRTVCELHARMGDHGLLCRDCREEGRPRAVGAVPPALPEPVRQVVYRRGDFASHMGDDDFDFFDTDERGDAFSTLS